MERVFITNIMYNNDPLLLRTWPSKGSVCSRLDAFQQFSIPFLGRNKHPELDTITIIKEITGTVQAQKLLNW